MPIFAHTKMRRYSIDAKAAMTVCSCTMVDGLVAVATFISRHAITVEVGICINTFPVSTVNIRAEIFFVVTEKTAVSKCTVACGSVRV